MNDRVLFEPHAHTKETSRCGWLSAGDLIAELKEKGYAGVVITDHYNPGERETAEDREAFLTGYRAAKAAGDGAGVVVLPGMEIRFKDHKEEYLVYGMEESDFASLPDDVCNMMLSSFHELAQEKGWLVYQAHPFRRKQLPANPSFIDGMEIFNGNPRHNSQNRLAANFATLHNLNTIAGSDVHRQGDVGVVSLLVPRDVLTPKAFVKWLGATSHPIIQHQDTPVAGIRYLVGAIPGKDMLETLYLDARWTTYTRQMDKTLIAIRNSDRIITAWDDTTLVGFARAITDCVSVVYVQDIVVMSTYHRRGIGREIMRRLLYPYQHISQTVLLADNAPHIRAFYNACGFENVEGYNSVAYIRLK